MAKRKAFKTAIDKVSESMKPEDLDKELEKARDMIKMELAGDDSPKPTGKKYSLVDAREPEPENEEKKRKPFTMMLRPDLRLLLNNVAQNNNVSLSQVIEDVLKEYFEIKD